MGVTYWILYVVGGEQKYKLGEPTCCIRGTINYGRGTVATKKEEIKIRLTKEQKELIKRVADKQGITMSEFILNKIEPLAKSIECNLDNKEMIEGSSMKLKMEKRKKR